MIISASAYGINIQHIWIGFGGLLEEPRRKLALTTSSIEANKRPMGAKSCCKLAVSMVLQERVSMEFYG